LLDLNRSSGRPSRRFARGGIAATMGVCGWVISTPAMSLPVDGSVDLIVGETQFLRLTDVKAADVDDAKIVSVEVMPAGEILLTPHAPGRALLFLVDSMRTAAWRIRVRQRGGRLEEVNPSDAARTAAAKACLAFKEEGSGDGLSVSATIVNAACRSALKRLFDTDGYRAKQLELLFTAESLQDQLADITERLKANGLPDVKIHYEGVTLVVSGTLPHGGWARLARALYEGAVGRVPPDFQVEEAPEPPKPAKP
jgi:hypothetical protein